MLNSKDFQKNCSFKSEIKHLIEISNLAYKSWEICWTNFIPNYIYEALLKDINNLSDLSYFVYGGYENADRSKIAFFRKSIQPEKKALISDFSAKGVSITGNFMFDNASQDDFRNFLLNIGIQEYMIGDIWTLGERGAQGFIENDQDFEQEKKYYLRDVEVKINFIDYKELKIPIQRVERLITSVEASLRLDAIASAGFRISRSKILNKIKSGLIFLNGLKIYKSTINLKIGDKVKLENKGYIEILEIEQTKRERWKIKLLRK